jgi:hypothetical protein
MLVASIAKVTALSAVKHAVIDAAGSDGPSASPHRLPHAPSVQANATADRMCNRAVFFMISPSELDKN